MPPFRPSYGAFPGQGASEQAAAAGVPCNTMSKVRLFNAAFSSRYVLLRALVSPRYYGFTGDETGNMGVLLGKVHQGWRPKRNHENRFSP